MGIIGLEYAEPSEKARDIAETYGYQPYMVERYIKMWGYIEALKYLKATIKGVKRVLRVNTLKVDPEKLISRLESRGYKFEAVEWAKNAFWILKEPFRLGATFEYMLGYYYLHRGGGSLAPPLALNPKPKELILDMCAAPGGKTTYIAELSRDKATILAVDISRARMRTLRSQISRLGISSVIALRWDARRLVELGLEPDKVLLDAPCSGEGLTPIDPSRRTKRGMRDLLDMKKLQLELLDVALKISKPGTTITYSTCSIAPEENEFVIDEVLEKWGEKVDVVEINLKIGDSGFDRVFGFKLDGRLRKCKRLYPHKHGTEGYFICQLVRN